MKPKPDPNLGWPIPLAAVELIADSEGLSLRAYRCPAGLPTRGSEFVVAYSGLSDAMADQTVALMKGAANSVLVP